MKTREERERELKQLMGTPEGNEQLLRLYKERHNIPQGQVIEPPGSLLTSMIAGILAKEFPEESQ